MITIKKPPIDSITKQIKDKTYLDDIIILPALIALTVKLIPKSVFAECRAQSEGIWRDGKPKKWYYAIPFVLIWIAVIALIIIAFI